MNNARVKIMLPQKEEVWFFIQPTTTVADLRIKIQKEDLTAKIFNALERPVGNRNAPTKLGDDDLVFDHIQK